MLGSELVQDAIGNVKITRQRMQVAQSHQKSYTNKRRKLLEFHKGDYVLLKISLTKGVIKFRLRGKLNSRYVEPFEILEQIREAPYRLALQPSLARVP